MKKVLKSLLGILSIFLLISCGKTDKKTLTIYTGLEEEYLNIYVEIYQKTHPEIELNIIRDSQGAIAAKVMAEGDNPQADVL